MSDRESGLCVPRKLTTTWFDAGSSQIKAHGTEQAKRTQAADSEKAWSRGAQTDLDQFLTLHSRFNKAGTDFLKVDLETALTFSGLALQSEDGTKRARNRRAARRAFDTIVRLLDRVQLSEAETKFFGRNLGRLKSELKELGEQF